MERRANVPTGTPLGRILYISIRIYWSITPTHHGPRVQRNAKTFRTHGSGIRCSPPDAFAVEPAPRNQYPPTGGSSTRWSHMSVGSASLFREGTDVDGYQYKPVAGSGVTGKNFRNREVSSAYHCHFAPEEIARGERAELSRQAVVAERKHPRSRSRRRSVGRKESNGEGGAGSEAAHQHGRPSLLVGHGP